MGGNHAQITKKTRMVGVVHMNVQMTKVAGAIEMSTASWVQAMLVAAEGEASIGVVTDGAIGLGRGFGHGGCRSAIESHTQSKAWQKKKLGEVVAH